MREPRPLATFLARPQHCSLYVRVRVFRTLADLRRYARWTGRSEPVRAQAVACCERVEMVYSGRDAKRAGRRMKLKQRTGEILLAKRYLWCDILVHECAHAALYMAKRLKIDPRDEGQAVAGYMTPDVGNERFCYLLGSLVNSVTKGLRKHRLIEE